MAKRIGCGLLTLSMLLHPLTIMAADVVVVEPHAGGTAKVGKVDGKIIRADDSGIYVKISKKDADFENHGDLETQRLIEMYMDKEWDRSHLLLFIPLSALRDHDAASSGSSDQEADTPGESKPRPALKCYLEGKEQGKHVSRGGSMTGGFIGGLFLGLIGTGLAVVAQNEPDVPYYAMPEDEDCQLPFLQGYREEGKSRKKSAALTGGIMGTLTLIGLLVSVSQ